MSGRRGVKKPPPRRATSRLRLGLGIGLAVIVAFAIGALVVLNRTNATVEPLSRLGTADVHSLTFVGDDAQRLLFGHHDGILETHDGGRTWTKLGAHDDAMGMSAAAGGSIVIAGHDVLTASSDGGQTWTNVATDLPSRDVHGFARDPADPSHMWAALATGGLWESRDAGLHFGQVYGENVLLPIAIDLASGTRLVAIAAAGLVQSDDGGRTWTPLGTPDLYPIVSLAATTNGAVLVAGGPDGLRRSDDGGRSWKDPGFKGDPFAVAVSTDGRTIALVTRKADFYRSDDGGGTWARP